MACGFTKSNATCRYIQIIEGAFYLVEVLGGDVGIGGEYRHGGTPGEATRDTECGSFSMSNIKTYNHNELIARECIDRFI
jgi:hypothetical protein